MLKTPPFEAIERGIPIMSSDHIDASNEDDVTKTETLAPSQTYPPRDMLSPDQLKELQAQYLRQILPQLQPITPPSSSTIGSFTQGLLVGQFSVIFVLILFIRFFIFGDTTSSQTANSGSPIINKKSKTKTFVKLHSANESENEEEQSRLTESILEKTYYDVSTHQPESLDWFNVLIAQTISQFREEALNHDNIYHSLSESLSKLPLPDFLDTINVTEIDIGNDFPIFSNCRIQQSAENGGRLEAKIDVDLSDTLTIGIDTKLLLNKPKPFTAALPVSLKVSIVRFSGCLTVSLISTSEDLLQGKTKAAADDVQDDLSDESLKGTALMFSFSQDYRLEFEVKSLIGGRSKLQDIPKIGSLIESKLKDWFVERCIEPRFQLVKLPSMWPRKKNTREPVVQPEAETTTVNEEDS